MTSPGNQPTLPNLPPNPAKRPLGWLSRWWDAGPLQKAALFAAILLIFVCTCCGASLIFISTPRGQTLAREGAATETVQAANAAHATAPAQEYALLHPAPTATPLPIGIPSPTRTPQPPATAKPIPTATPMPQVSHYPPATQADLVWLAEQGDMNALTVYSSQQVGLVGVCPQPSVQVIVDPSVTGEQLAEDLLAYYRYGQAQGLSFENPCGSVIFAYHSVSEAQNSDFYTAGRVLLDVYDSNGQVNIDPNATNLTLTVTLDVGGALDPPQEEVISYH